MAAFTWNIPAVAEYTVGTNVANDYLAAINSHFAANSSGGSAVWEVATYQSTTPRYIILRRKSGAAGRIIIFGEQGSTPNAAAVRSTATVSNLYIGYSKTSTSNTEDASWISAAPLSATDYMPGVIAFPNLASVQHRFTYAECTAGVWILVDQIATGCAVFGAGELMQDPSGADISINQGMGSSTWSTTSNSSFPQAGGAGAVFNATVTSDTASIGATLAATIARLSDGTVTRNQLIFRAFIAASPSNPDYQDPASLKSTWFPVLFTGNSTYINNAGYVGKLKQVASGPESVRATTWLNAATGVRTGYGHSYGTSAKAGTVWFLDVEI